MTTKVDEIALAVMHGSSNTGDCAGMQRALADGHRDGITTTA
jgi:hypothetical protein